MGLRQGIVHEEDMGYANSERPSLNSPAGLGRFTDLEMAEAGWLQVQNAVEDVCEMWKWQRTTLLLGKRDRDNRGGEEGREGRLRPGEKLLGKFNHRD